MLVENRDVLDRISEYLYDKETITGKEFMKMFREMKGIEQPEEEKNKTDIMGQPVELDKNEKEPFNYDNIFEE